MEKRTKADVWRQRVEEWRASGLTADEFGKTRGFQGGALRHWASALKMTKPRRRKRDTEPGSLRRLQLARVVRVRQEEKAATLGRDQAGGLELVVGRVRIGVQPGFDRTTLGAVLDVIEGWGAGHAGGIGR